MGTSWFSNLALILLEFSLEIHPSAAPFGGDDVVPGLRVRPRAQTPPDRSGLGGYRARSEPIRCDETVEGGVCILFHWS